MVFDLKKWTKEYGQIPEVKKRKREYMREYRKKPEHKKKESKHRKQYYLKNKNKILRRQRKYRSQDKSKQKIKKWCANYYLNNKNRILQRNRIYNKNYLTGDLITKTINKLIPKEKNIIRMYLKEKKDLRTIAKKLGVRPHDIMAILSKNKIIRRNPYVCTKHIICSNGLKVRSNPERRIVEMLLSKNIIFEYEPLISLKNKRFFPDFYFPNLDLYIDYAGFNGKEYSNQLKKKESMMLYLNKNYVIIDNEEDMLGVLNKNVKK